MYRITCLALIILCLGFHGAMCHQGYPKPKAKSLLFYIQHNQGHNTYLYQLNVASKGGLDQEKPIKVSRQLFDKNGEIRPLTDIQRRFAYGVKTRRLDDQSFSFVLAAYPEQEFLLKIISPGQGAVYTVVNRSEEHTSELQSRENLVCRLLLEKKKT